MIDYNYTTGFIEYAHAPGHLATMWVYKAAAIA